MTKPDGPHQCSRPPRDRQRALLTGSRRHSLLLDPDAFEATTIGLGLPVREAADRLVPMPGYLSPVRLASWREDRCKRTRSWCMFRPMGALFPDPQVRVFGPVDLCHPSLIAAWPGIGLVGYNAVEFLRGALEAQPLAEIDTGDFFSVQGIHVKDGVCLPPRHATNVFHVARSGEGRPDILLFLGSAQPVAGREMPLACIVLEAARRMGIERIYTAAAMVTQIDHTAQPRVWGVTSAESEWGALEKVGVQKLQEGAVGGLNGLLIGVAQQERIPASCLMGEMPHYTTQIENPKASLAVVEILAALLGLAVDVTPLMEKSRFVELQIRSVLQAARAQQEGAQPAEAPQGSDEAPQEEPPAVEDEDRRKTTRRARKPGEPPIN